MKKQITLSINEDVAERIDRITELSNSKGYATSRNEAIEAIIRIGICTFENNVRMLPTRSKA